MRATRQIQLPTPTSRTCDIMYAVALWFRLYPFPPLFIFSLCERENE